MQKIFIFSILGEEYLRKFVERAFEMQGKVGRKKAQKDFTAEGADSFDNCSGHVARFIFNFRS